MAKSNRHEPSSSRPTSLGPTKTDMKRVKKRKDHSHLLQDDGDVGAGAVAASAADMNVKIGRNFKHKHLLEEGEVGDSDFKVWLLANDPISTFRPLKACLKPYDFVSHVVKKPIRGLVLLIYDLKEAGYALEGKCIRRRNLTLCQGVLKLKVPKLVEFTDAAFDESCRALGDFIKKVFKNSAVMPLDMVNLVSLLHDKPRETEDLIKYHFVFMNDKAKRHFICQWHDMKLQFNNDQERRYKMACRKLPNFENWCEQVKQCKDLEIIFEGGRKGKNKNTRDVSQPMWFRNALIHILKSAWEGLDRSLPQPPHFRYDDCVKILLSYFDEPITAFPKLLFEQGLLPLFRIKKYFY